MIVASVDGNEHEWAISALLFFTSFAQGVRPGRLYANNKAFSKNNPLIKFVLADQTACTISHICILADVPRIAQGPGNY